MIIGVIAYYEIILTGVKLRGQMKIKRQTSMRQKSFAVTRLNFAAPRNAKVQKIAVVSWQKYEISRLFCGQNVTFLGSFPVKLTNIVICRGKHKIPRFVAVSTKFRGFSRKMQNFLIPHTTRKIFTFANKL